MQEPKNSKGKNASNSSKFLISKSQKFTKKKFLTSLIALELILLNTAVPANAASFSFLCSAGGTFTYESSTNEVTSSSACAGTANIDNGTLTIAANAFKNAGALTGINFPNTLIEIKNDAFYATGLTSVVIPNSVTSINARAFAFTEDLTSLTIGNNVLTIGEESFRWTRNLTSVVIPDSVTSIGNGAFWSAREIRSLTLGNSVTTIGDQAFRGLLKLETLVIPNSVTSIGSNAFSSAELLSSLTIGNSVTTIGNSAFGDAYSLRNLTLGNSVTTIGDFAFSFSGLESVTIPSSTTSIGQRAFVNSLSLSSITFLGNAPSVGVEAFKNTAAGAKAYINPDATGFGANGSIWNGLIVTHKTSSNSSSSSSPSAIVEPTADLVIGINSKRSIFKSDIKKQIQAKFTLDLSRRDRYRYEVFNSSRNFCRITSTSIRFKSKSGTCDFYITRNSISGLKQAYWVKINLTNN